MKPQEEQGRISTADIAGRHPDEERQFESHGGAAMAREERPSSLFTAAEAEQMRSRWSDIQAGFVDEPRHAVEQADQLVAQTIQRLAQVFADERGKLEQQWAKGGDVSTEDLRVGLQRYRSFFSRLLSV